MLIAFLIIAAVIFFVVVKPTNTLLARLQRDKDPATDVPSDDVMLLTEIRDLLREQGARPPAS